MSEAKKSDSKKATTGAKKIDAKVEEGSKEKKAGPASILDGNKKENSKTENSQKDAKDKKMPKLDPRKDKSGLEKENTSKTIENKEDDPDYLKISKVKNPEELPKEKQSEVQALLKMLALEYSNIAKLFSKTIDQGLIKMEGDADFTAKLIKQNIYYKTLQDLCKTVSHCARESFVQVTSIFKHLERNLTNQIDSKHEITQLTNDAEIINKSLIDIEKKISVTFYHKCNEEMSQKRNKHEIVTVKGLDSETEHRLLSANYLKKDTKKEKKEGDSPAAHATDVKVNRTTCEGLIDKIFVGTKQLSTTKKEKSDLKEEHALAFNDYRKRFQIKSSPDTVVKGMGILS